MSIFWSRKLLIKICESFFEEVHYWFYADWSNHIRKDCGRLNIPFHLQLYVSSVMLMNLWSFQSRKLQISEKHDYTCSVQSSTSNFCSSCRIAIFIVRSLCKQLLKNKTIISSMYRVKSTSIRCNKKANFDNILVTKLEKYNGILCTYV